MSFLYWGPESWIQQQKERIASPDLLPRMQLASWAVTAHSWFISNFLLIKTPTSFSVGLLLASFPVLLVSGMVQTQRQHEVLGFVELHEILLGPSVPGLPRWHTVLQVCPPHHSPCKLAVGALTPTVCVIDKDIRSPSQSQDTALSTAFVACLHPDTTPMRSAPWPHPST
ncbi:hypothetical protein Nmel_011215 [Mimus melanotis]